MNIFLSLFFLSISVFADNYREKIQPIFDNRCIACHSCLNGPCQLNLQNYDGFIRGAHSKNAYDGTRIQSVHPTRPNIDGNSALDWKNLGFFNLNTSTKLDDNLFYTFLNEKEEIKKNEIPIRNAEESAFCIDDNIRAQVLFKVNRELKMPYGLPPLKKEERETLGTWLSLGALGPTPQKISKDLLTEVSQVESFFNRPSNKNQLVSRYLYEHLFLAHFYFKENPKQFFRLIRSKNSCESNRYQLEEINTRRPNDLPSVKKFYYCLRPLDLTIVAKTHMPFELSRKIMTDWNNLFFGKDWEVKNPLIHEKAYNDLASANPFEVFFDIPVESRYRFLIQNSHYIVSTFIKGPVCNGSKAVNSIQEQFFTMFIDPKSDLMVRSREFETKAKDLLILPGLWGSDISPFETITLNKQIIKHREGYRKLRAEYIQKYFPQGYSYENLWDGDGKNDNATLTIFRHNDNAVVMKGLKGELPKTAFFLDYALMERLVYNLVVNFDVFGNISHQMLTRIYMDLIRMEAEEIFLSFLPPESRQSYRNEWYKGILTKPMMEYIFPLLAKEHPTSIKFKTKHYKKEFFENTFYHYLKPEVRGSVDALNWKKLSHFPLGTNHLAPELNEVEKTLRSITSIEANNGISFPNFLPENSYLYIEGTSTHDSQVYTIIKNTEHDNISWILGEALRFNPKEDRITLLPGFYSYYPNAFYRVKKSELEDFTKALLNMKRARDYKKFFKKYGVSRVSKDFWPTYDALTDIFQKTNPIEFGYLDLTRYVLE